MQSVATGDVVPYDPRMNQPLAQAAPAQSTQSTATGDFVPYDPRTNRPLAQAAPTPQTAPVQNQPVVNTQQQARNWSPEAFAAQSAELQAREAQRHGEYVTQDAFEAMRKEAYQQAMQTQREMALDQQRQQAELARQMKMRTFEQFGPREMTPEEIKDAAGLTNATDQIMMLHHQNQDIPATDPYRAAFVGDPTAAIAKMTDPRIRLYEATRGGSIISLGRGLLQDTGQVAGKEQAQDLIKQLMPGPGDSPEMSSRKTIDMLQMTMNGVRAKIDALPTNVDSTPLKNAYARAYANYQQLLPSGSDAQKNFPALAPNQLWQNAPQVPQVGQAVVKAGLSGPSQNVLDNLNRQIQGQPSQPPGQFVPVDPRTNQPLQQQAPQQTRAGWPGQYGIPSQFPSYPGKIGAAVQQAGQFAGGPTVRTPATFPQPDPALVAQLLQQQQPQPTIFQTVPQAVGRGAQGVWNFLQGLLPENYPQGSMQQ